MGDRKCSMLKMSILMWINCVKKKNILLMERTGEKINMWTNLTCDFYTLIQICLEREKLWIKVALNKQLKIKCFFNIWRKKNNNQAFSLLPFCRPACWESRPSLRCCSGWRCWFAPCWTKSCDQPFLQKTSQPRNKRQGA